MPLLSFLQVFHLKFPIHYLYASCMLHAPSISFSLTESLEEYLEESKRKNQQAPHYVHSPPFRYFLSLGSSWQMEMTYPDPVFPEHPLTFTSMKANSKIILDWRYDYVIRITAKTRWSTILHPVITSLWLCPAQLTLSMLQAYTSLYIIWHVKLY
jgi:hypothetical protein